MTEITMTRKEAIAKKRAIKRKKKAGKVTTMACVAVMGAAFMNVNSVKVAACSDTYTIKNGDTLYSLAKKYNVTVEQLKNANGLTSDFIRTGMDLAVPAAHLIDQEKKVINLPEYTVVGGDTLWSVAKRFGTSVSAIKHANNTDKDFILIGQKLIIPVQAKTETFTTIGAVDSTSIEVLNKCGEPVVLKVPFGKALDYQKQSGKELNITFTKDTFAVLSIR
ncbi:LysM peptidoglycan-binding domain-containing protein [Metabacillus iocasae]|uniref:LysM repeat protein n=1 Tax=Priestia iocasae TaxID=2291674 RepID=A0ABS2QWT4_9BACI|nr:LysM peptidoglycan-binding domain-containing protein [Metabacillus iocasae]MBM7703877.1 LysM repeat protein [Metabacillus iocasae]